MKKFVVNKISYAIIFLLAVSCYGNPEMKPNNIKINKILFLGNSLTIHGPSAAVDWHNNWGMAATSQENDYVHILTRSLSKKIGGTPKIMIENIGGFEKNYKSYDINKKLKKCFEFKADTVIMAIGENVPVLDSENSKTKFKNSVNKLLNSIKTNSNPVIVVRSCFWPYKDVDKILKQSCKEVDGIFVDIGNLSKDESNYARSERKFTHKGVAAHPGDKGMKNIAYAIFNKMKFQRKIPLNTEKILDIIRTPEKFNK